MNMMLDPMYMQPQPQQDSLRFLHNITQGLVSQVTYAKACRQLIHWCCTLTVYQPQFENALLSCLSAAATCATKPGFDIDLAFQLFQSCCNFKSQASPQFNERLKTLWDDLNEEVALKRSGNQEQAQRIAQQIQIQAAKQAAQQAMPSKETLPNANQHMNQQHFPNTREIPEYSSLGASETTVSVVTTVYSGMTSRSVSPSHHAPTTVSIPSSSQPSITTSSPSAIPTPAETQPTNANTSVLSQPNPSPVSTVQTAAIFAAAHATATATATALTASKLSSAPPGSPTSDTPTNKPPPQNLPRPHTAPIHMPQQLERRMSTPLTPMNPLMAALSGPTQYPDSPHQLNQLMMPHLNDPMVHSLHIDGMPIHPQPPPPYNHIANQRTIQMPPTYQDVTTILPAGSPMQPEYIMPNKMPQGGMMMMGHEHHDQFTASYPPQMVYGKPMSLDMGSPYEYPPMMTRPNSLYLPPSSYDGMVANPKSYTDTRSYMTPGMGFDVMMPGPGMHSPYMNSVQQQHNRMYPMQTPSTGSPTKLTQPMQFPTHMVPTPNHAMMTPNYMMNQKMYPQSAPVGFQPPPEFPQQNKDHIEINKHGDQVIRLTTPIPDGILLAPFQLQHNNNSVSHRFMMRENLFPSLINRVDLDVQLRCYQSGENNPNAAHPISSWPKDQDIYVTINNYRIIINESESKMQKPLLLKKYCVPGVNMLQLNVKACCCSHLFELNLVHRPSITSVKSRLFKERLVDREQSLNKIIEFMSPRQSEEDLHTTSASTSLKCPITQKVIEIPIRGNMCRHIQCFDLGSFLHMNHERETWKCPICAELAIAVLNYVEVDGFIYKILQDTQKSRIESSEDLTDIVIDDKGNWSYANIKQEKRSPNKRCKQEADSPSPESPKKPAKRRKLSASKKKLERVEPANNYNSQPSVPNILTRNETHTMPALLKDFPMKNFDNFSPHMSRTPLSGPNSVDSRGDRVINSPLMMPIKNSPGLSLADSQLEPSIHLDPGFSDTNLLDVFQHGDHTPSDDLPY